MKCRYRFPVRSRIKPSTLHPVKVGDSACSFFADSGFIDRVEVIVPADPEQDVPKVDMLPGTRPVTGIQVRHPKYDEILHSLRVTEGLLSLYGMIGIEEEFKKNSSLLDAIKKTIVAFRPPQGEPLIAKNFDEHYKGKHPEEVVERFVTIRGFLHHHNPKRTGMWHPERQEEYEVDSLIMQGVCFSLASDLSIGHICSQKTTSAFQKLFAKKEDPQDA